MMSLLGGEPFGTFTTGFLASCGGGFGVVAIAACVASSEGAARTPDAVELLLLPMPQAVTPPTVQARTTHRSIFFRFMTGERVAGRSKSGVSGSRTDAVQEAIRSSTSASTSKFACTALTSSDSSSASISLSSLRGIGLVERHSGLRAL